MKKTKYLILKTYKIDGDYKIKFIPGFNYHNYLFESANTKIQVRQSLRNNHELIEATDLIVCKVLEYTGFGSKTTFFIKTAEHLLCPSIAYIASKDVYTKNLDKHKVFYDYSYKSDKLKLNYWNQGFKSKDFIALSMLNDILLLQNTMENKPENYGMIVSKFIDNNSYKPHIIGYVSNQEGKEFNYKNIDS